MAVPVSDRRRPKSGSKRAAANNPLTGVSPWITRGNFTMTRHHHR